MALTAALRTLLITLAGLGVSWVVAKLNLVDLIDVKAVAETVANAIIVAGSGLVAYVVNKLGSRWAWINYILSFGRAKSSSVYIPSNMEEATATATPPGEQTKVTTTDAAGKQENVVV